MSFPKRSRYAQDERGSASESCGCLRCACTTQLPSGVVLKWFHVQWGTYGSWLPGDPRGFRNRDHRVHSSGNYKSPPPEGEHAGLRRYARMVQREDAVVFTSELRAMAGEAIVEKAADVPIPMAALAVCAKHVHALLKLDPRSVGIDVGKLKRHSSHVTRMHLKGSVWRARKHEVAVTTMTQFRACLKYIERHRDEGAFTWLDERVRERGDDM